MDPNLKVAFAPLKITQSSINNRLNAMMSKGQTNLCTKETVEFLADDIFKRNDPNAARALAESFASMKVGIGNLGATVEAFQALCTSWDEWAKDGKLTPRQCAENSMDSAMTYMAEGFVATVMNYWHRTLTTIRLDPCRLCPPQCCCDPSVPFDFNGDGTIDATDLADLTAQWLQKIP